MESLVSDQEDGMIVVNIKNFSHFWTIGRRALLFPLNHPSLNFEWCMNKSLKISQAVQHFTLEVSNLFTEATKFTPIFR